MRKFLFVLGKVIAAIMGAMTALFLTQLTQIPMLPPIVIFFVGAILAVLVGLALWLTWSGMGKIRMVVGINELDSKTALAFCRERHAFKDGDHQRGRNQMAVIQGVIRKLMSPALLTNYLDVLRSVEGSFETSIPMELVGSIVAQQLRNGGEWNVVTYSVSGKGDSQIPYSLGKEVYVMQPDYATVEHAKDLMRKVYNGEAIEP